MDEQWDDGHPFTGYYNNVKCVAISKDESRVVFGSVDRKVPVWKRRDEKWNDGHPLTGSTKLVECVVTSTKENQVLSGSYGRTGRVWEK